MKFCYQCGIVTAGKPLFCNFCGRSYDMKLCPRLHQNPRKAEACSRCGNRNLSIPQPSRPILWQIAALAIFIVAGLLVAVVSLDLVLKLKASRPTGVPASLQLEAVLLGLLWGAWAIVLPHVLKIVLHRFLKFRRNRYGS